MTTSERRDLAIPVPDGIGLTLRTYGRGYGSTKPTEVVLRGGREEIAAVLIKALADLAGDE